MEKPPASLVQLGSLLRQAPPANDVLTLSRSQAKMQRHASALAILSPLSSRFSASQTSFLRWISQQQRALPALPARTAAAILLRGFLPRLLASSCPKAAL